MAYYDTSELGPFPKRQPPETHRPPLTDRQDVMGFNAIYAELSQLDLAVYTPLKYVFESRLQKYAEMYDTQLDNERGFIDPFGQVTLYGRIDEVINFGGQKLHPTDLEAIADPYMNNEKFIIVGMRDPNDVYGEIPVMIRTSDQVELDQIQRDMSWAKKRTQIVKSVGKKVNLLPKIGYYMNEIPFTKSGKPKRKLISLKLND